jgi:hypothetical protein
MMVVHPQVAFHRDVDLFGSGYRIKAGLGGERIPA